MLTFYLFEFNASLQAISIRDGGYVAKQKNSLSYFTFSDPFIPEFDPGHTLRPHSPEISKFLTVLKMTLDTLTLQ